MRRSTTMRPRGVHLSVARGPDEVEDGGPDPDDLENQPKLEEENVDFEKSDDGKTPHDMG